MNIPLGGSLLLIEGSSSFLLAGQFTDRTIVWIETCTDEYAQGVRAGELVAVSAPDGADLDAARMLLELVRRHHLPLVVLPANHPGSGRLPLVVSVGPEIHLSCDIRRGTHPEQDLLCSGDDLAGTCLRGAPGGVEITGLPDGARWRLVPPLKTDQP